MTRWRTVTLGEALEFAYGKSLPKKSRVAGDIPVYGSNGISGWNDTALVHEPTVIVGRKGSAGAIQFVERPSFPIDTTYFVRPRDGYEIDMKFVYYLLRSINLPRLATATGVPGLTREDVYREVINVPIIEEQRRIVDLLSRAEGIVRLRREAQRKAAELVPALFLHLFGDPASNPKGWSVMELGELIVDGPQNGLYKHKSHYGSGTPILRIDGFYDGVVRNLSALQRLAIEPEEIERYRLTPGNIVINRVNSPEYLGKSALIPELTESTVFESNMMRFGVDHERITSQFLIAMLQTKALRQQILSGAKHAINQSSINQQDVKALRITVPPITLQHEFAAKAEAIRSIAAQQASALATAKTAFTALLHRAFAPA